MRHRKTPTPWLAVALWITPVLTAVAPVPAFGQTERITAEVRTRTSEIITLREIGFGSPAASRGAPPGGAQPPERLPGQRGDEGARSGFGMVVEVTLKSGERVRLRGATFAREGEPLGERSFLYVGSQRVSYTRLRRITVNRVTEGTAFGPHALGGGTYADVELTDGRFLPDMKMTWQSVFGWERPGRQGKFYDLEAEEILRIDFLAY